MDWNSTSPKEMSTTELYNFQHDSVLVGISSNELDEWKKAYMQDKLYSKILKVSQMDNDEDRNILNIKFEMD